jgi:signal peptidase I
MRNELSAAEENDFMNKTRMGLKKEYRTRERWSWVFSIGAAVAIALILRFFVFEFIRVDGESMQPTLYTDQYVFMEKVTYWFSEPECGDIIICSYPAHTDTYVKRVIGMAGDRIRVTGGVLYINDVANYDYFKGVMNNDMDEVTVPADHVFVMGDNRNASMDSTNPSIGPLPDSMVQGKALFVIWPLNNIHGI